MSLRRAGLLAAAFSLAMGTTASAGTLMMWEFAGELSRVPSLFGLAELYPVHTPFRLDISFDPAASRIAGTGAQGIYRAIGESTMQIGDSTFSSSDGFIAVNCHFEIGCLPGFPALSTPVEFWMLNWSPAPLNPAVPGLSAISNVQVFYNDPAAANGRIPTTPPTGPAGLQIAVGGGGQPPITTIGGTVQSIQAISDVAVVPEPGTLVLLATGLTALAGRRRRRIRRAPSS